MRNRRWLIESPPIGAALSHWAPLRFEAEVVLQRDPLDPGSQMIQSDGARIRKCRYSSDWHMKDELFAVAVVQPEPDVAVDGVRCLYVKHVPFAIALKSPQATIDMITIGTMPQDERIMVLPVLWVVHHARCC